MNEQQLWAELQQLVYQSGDTSEVTHAQWERLVQLHASPPLPTQLIIQTVYEKGVGCGVWGVGNPILKSRGFKKGRSKIGTMCK